MNIQGIGQSFTAYQPMQMRGMPGSFDPSNIDVSKIMEKKDANLDGVITADETAMTEDMFSGADTDGDGQLTTEELEEMIANGPPMGGMKGRGGMMPPMGGMGGMGSGQIDVQTILDQEDEDGDGQISAEESSLPDELFAKVDTNQDGVASAEEIEASIAKMEERRAAKLDWNQQTALNAYQEAVQSFMTNFDEDTTDSYFSSFLGTIA